MNIITYTQRDTDSKKKTFIRNQHTKTHTHTHTNKNMKREKKKKERERRMAEFYEKKEKK